MKTNAFVRQLASNKRAVRENALATLKKFLSSKEKAAKLDSAELNKLWKGLFYTMWFCDRPRPQQRLANELAGLFSNSIVEEQFCKFVESFWRIMINEWRDLDKWRTDKFLMLMRYVIRECFVRMKKNDWNEAKLELYFDTLKSIILKDDVKTPRAITYHIIDVWVDELERVIFGEDEDEEQVQDDKSDDEESKEDKYAKIIEERKKLMETEKVPFDALLAPMKELSSKEHFEPLVKKIRMEVLEDERLLELGIDTSLAEDAAEEENKESDDGEYEDEEEFKGFSL